METDITEMLPDRTCSEEMQDLLATAIKGTTREARREIRSFIRSQMTLDGGFKNRSGASDLYYSVFGGACMQALRSVFIPRIAVRYLKQFGSGDDLDFVHRVCLARALSAVQKASTPGHIATVMNRIEDYRSHDGGYNHRQCNASNGTPYAAFLAMLAYEDAQIEPPGFSCMLQSIENCRTVDGAYSNEPGMQEGSATATAAAAILRVRFGQAVESGISQWIISLQSDHGGFLASPTSPSPDLLSTAVCLFALRTLQVSLSPLQNSTGSFVQTLWMNNGGFCGHIFDDVADCEYTFYALLALGCLESN